MCRHVSLSLFCSRYNMVGPNVFFVGILAMLSSISSLVSVSVRACVCANVR